MDKKIIASELLKIAKNIDAGFFIQLTEKLRSRKKL